MDRLAHKRHTDMTASAPVPEEENGVAGKEREEILSADELREAVRAVQREGLEALERECAEREAFRKATTKLHPQQKRILRWLWVETQMREAYLEANDVDDPEFKEEVRRATDQRAIRNYHDALFFKGSGRGLPWSLQAITGAKPTKSQKSSVSRSKNALIVRGLVRHSSPRTYDNYIILTPLGRHVSNLLTPPAVTPRLDTK